MNYYVEVEIDGEDYYYDSNDNPTIPKSCWIPPEPEKEEDVSWIFDILGLVMFLVMLIVKKFK